MTQPTHCFMQLELNRKYFFLAAGALFGCLQDPQAKCYVVDQGSKEVSPYPYELVGSCVSPRLEVLTSVGRDIANQVSVNRGGPGRLGGRVDGAERHHNVGINVSRSREWDLPFHLAAASQSSNSRLYT